MKSFLKLPGVILDVRSPKEYQHAHIPGAYNLPLFTDEERALVGTCYKQVGRNQAVELGLQLVGPKLHLLVKEAKTYHSPVKVYCARGGMRSGFVSYLLKTAGLEVTTLTHGYKRFRNWVLEELAQPRKIAIVGGFTGSGKTHVLHALAAQGHQILDLEKLANHRGSSFGHLGPQPSIEFFENQIACHLIDTHPDNILWIEDESRMIGTCQIPPALYRQMREAPLFKLDRPRDERVENLIADYGSVDTQILIDSTKRLQKRLGKVNCDLCIHHIKQGALREAFHLLLNYYDGTYTYGISKRKTIISSSCAGLSFDECARNLCYDDTRFT